MLADKLRAATAAKPLPTFVSSSVGQSLGGSTAVVSAPSGIQNGDLLVAVTYTATDRTVTPPTGFRQIAYQSDGNVAVSLNVKTAASESGSYTFTFSGSTGGMACILVYRNATSVNTVGSRTFANSATVTAASITPSFRGVLCAAFFASNQLATFISSPSGMTQRAVSTGQQPIGTIWDVSPQEATATTARTVSLDTSSANAGFQFQITNESTVAPEFVASASQQNTAAGGTLTINCPAGTQQGDLMVAVMSCSGAVTDWTDTTFTEAADQGFTAPGLRVAYKVAGASEPSSYSFTQSDTSRTLSGCILTYRFAAYDTVGSFVSGANPLVLTSISPADSQSILIAAGSRGAASITLGTPTSMTARVTDADGTSPSYIVCDQAVAKGPTGTRSISTGGTASTAGILLSIKPTRSLS